MPTLYFLLNLPTNFSLCKEIKVTHFYIQSSTALHPLHRRICPCLDAGLTSGGSRKALLIQTCDISNYDFHRAM